MSNEHVEDGWYLADRFSWAAPGDQQEDAWIVRFSDKDCGEAIFTGPNAKDEARAYWNRYAPSFNIYVFRLACLATTSCETKVAEAVEKCAQIAEMHGNEFDTDSHAESAKLIAAAIRSGASA